MPVYMYSFAIWPDISRALEGYSFVDQDPAEQTDAVGEERGGGMAGVWESLQEA